MSRIVSIGPAIQNIIMVDRDDFVGRELENGQSVFTKLTIGAHADIDKAIFAVGGSGANAAVTFARSGHETILMSTLARDSVSESVLSMLDRENIDSSYLEFARGATGCSVILVDAKTSQRTTLDFRGVSEQSARLDPENLQNIEPDWVYLSTLGGDFDKLGQFISAAHQLRAKVLLAPGAAELGSPSKLTNLLKDVDVLVVNKSEAAKLVPGVVLTELLAKLSQFCKITIITDGIMGAIATNHKQTFRLGVYEQVHVQDATGAGDAFASGFLASFAEDGDFERALRFAAANASKVVEAYGAEAGIIDTSADLHPMPMTLVKNLSEWIQAEKKEENA